MTPTHRLSDRVVWLVGRASLRAQRLIADRFVSAELRKQHYGILASLADRGPATQAPLADRLGLDRSDLVSLLDDLEAHEYVVRRPDPDDRRRKIVEITARGATALKKLDQLVYAADDEMLADLTGEERETLARLLERILPAADRVGAPPPGSPPEHMCTTQSPPATPTSVADGASAAAPRQAAGSLPADRPVTDSWQVVPGAGSDGSAGRA